MNTVPLTFSFSQINKKKLYNQIGNKALNLGIMFQNNFSVPNGFVVNNEVYSLYIKHNNLKEVIKRALSSIDYNNYEAIEKSSKTIQEAFLIGSLPPELEETIINEYKRLSSESVAVRSSGTAEDLPFASFAGAYNSFLNVKTKDQILDYIKQCYASIWTNRAILYRYKNEISHDDAKMAIIVQKMIPAKCSGITFTRNPVSASKKEILIESNYGLGESIASGYSSPDQFIVSREKQKGTFKILSKQIGKKDIMVIPSSKDKESGTQCTSPSERDSMKSSLSDHQILQLAHLGIEIEKCFKSPQDIEWVIDKKNKIFLLQSRPITTKVSIDSRDNLWFTRGYSDDYWNDPCTPLFFDILGDQLTKVVNMELNSIMGYRDLPKKLLKLYNGHVYFNLEVLKKKVENEIPSIMRNEDVLNYFPEGFGPYGKETIKNLPFHTIRRIVAELRIMSFDPDGSISKTADSYYIWSDQIFNPYCDIFDEKLKDLEGKGDLQALVNLAKDLDDIMIKHFRLVRYGIPVHNIGMNLLVQYLLTRFLGKDESSKLYPILISGLEHKLTETNNEILKLASIIYQNSELKSLISDKKSKELNDLIIKSNDPKIQEFRMKFNEFLKKYGDRGFSREALYPRWNEAPQYVFDILKSLTQGKKSDLRKIKTQELDYRRKTEQLVEAKIRSQRFGLIKWKIFTIILKNSRKYIKFRENQRFNVDRWFTRNRKVYLEIGKNLSNLGLINEKTDVFFLHKKELNKLIIGELDVNTASLIEKRKSEFLKYEHVIPPKFLFGDREFDDEFRYTEDSALFRGLPASQGILTAKIRVLNKISEISTIHPGEILVVRQTDPGWTPAFKIIGGLITETGGVLSHGAVVAREYNIPAVTNVPNACKIFRTGQIVKIDGYSGTVIPKN